MRALTKREKHEDPSRNSETEEYNNWIEKFIRGIQYQTWPGRRKNQQTLRLSKLPGRGAKRKKWKKGEGLLEHHQVEQCTHYGSHRRRRKREGQRAYLKK